MSNLDKFKETIKKAKENKGKQEGLQFEFESVEPGSWSDFLIKTDIGRIIAQNGQVNFKDSNGRRTRGAFLKLDENTFAQVSLLGSGRSAESHVGITFFPKEELNQRTQILINYDNPNYIRDLESSRKALLEFEDFDINRIPTPRVGRAEESEEDAKKLIDKFGIPKSKEEIDYILKEGKDTRDSCLFTYASLLCEQAPQVNEYVDELIALSIQNCEAEHVSRLIYDYRIISEGIHIGAEKRYNSNPDISGFSWGKFAGKKITKGQIPLNFERRKRVMLAIYKGMIRNPNIKIEQMTRFISTLSFDEDDPVAKEFINAQFNELKKAIETGECAFNTEELMAGAKKYIGIRPEELQEVLGNSNCRLENEAVISPAAVVKNALKTGITLENVNKVKGLEESILNPENIKEGETKDD